MRRVAVTGIGAVTPLGLDAPGDLARRARGRERHRLDLHVRHGRTARAGRRPRSRTSTRRRSSRAKEAQTLERNVLLRRRGRSRGAGRRGAERLRPDARRHRLRLGDRRRPRHPRAGRHAARARAGPRLAELPAERARRLRLRPARDLARHQGPELRRRLRLRDRLARRRRGRRDDQARRRRRGARGRHRVVHRAADPRRLHARCAGSRSRTSDPPRASRPFDATRAGFVMAEGAGALLLEDWETAERRGAEIYAEVLGYGASNDAHHMAQPEPEATGVAAMMRGALERAGVDPERVGYINAHGTSTPLGDAAETQGDQGRVRRPRVRARGLVDEVDDGPHASAPPGAIEAIMCALALRDGVLPPTINYSRARSRLRPRLRAERGAARAWSTWRSRTRWGSAATTAASCSAALRDADARPQRDAAARDGRRTTPPRRPDAARRGHDAADREHAEPGAEPARRAAVSRRGGRARDRRLHRHAPARRPLRRCSSGAPSARPADPHAARERRRAQRARLHERRGHLRRLARPRPRADAGQHGTGEIGAALGAGLRLRRRRVYVAGDTIWCDEVREAIEQHRPHTVVVNAGGARFNEGDPIVMTVDDVRTVRAAADGRVVVVHLEAINHCLERREDYRAHRRRARAATTARRSTSDGSTVSSPSDASTTSASASASSPGG